MGSVSEFLKEGTKYLTGLEEAILRNIEAVKQLSDMTRTSLGPNGMNKIVINHIEKLFVTSDANTIAKELDVIHPAARMLVLAAAQQESEIGDGTNLTMILTGEFLSKAETLLRMGIHPSDVLQGYEKAGKKALEILATLRVHQVTDLRNEDAVVEVLRPVIASKLYGCEGILAPLIAKACISVCPKESIRFGVDKVRVVKILGGSLGDSHIMKGMVLRRGAESALTSVTNAKVAVFAGALDTPMTETKGTVLIKNAEQLLNYSQGEESQMETIIKAIASSGVNVVVTGAAVGEMALHFLNRHNIMVVKAPSKFDIRRLCETCAATPLVRLGAPTPDEIGTCDSVQVRLIGSTQVVVFEQSEARSQIATIILRGATQNQLDDVERAIDDGVNVYKQMTKQADFVVGAGAAEMEIARQLQTFSESIPGLDQFSTRRFGEAFEVVPRTLGETSGANVLELITTMYAQHATNPHIGINVDNEGSTHDAKEARIWDLYATKHNAIRLAVDTALTVLRVDSIIMAKVAGGPKIPQQNGPGAGGRDED